MKEKTHMKKKLLSLALVLTMALTLLPTAAFAATFQHTGSNEKCTDNTIEWTTATISKAAKHVQHCTVCSAQDDTTAHDPKWSDTYTQDAAAGKHWKSCTGAEGCTMKSDEGTCAANQTTPGYSKDTGDDATTHHFVCDKCKQPYGSAVDCKYNPSSHECVCGRVDPTYTTPDGTETLSSVTIGVTNGTVVTPGGHVNIVILSGRSDRGLVSPEAILAAFYLNSDTISWKLNDQAIDPQPKAGTAPAAEGTYTVEGEITAKTTSAAKAAGDTTLVLGQGVKGTGTIIVSAGVPEEKPENPTTPETPVDTTTPPSTNSQGIPVASEVNSAKQADDAITSLKKTSVDNLADNLMANSSALSSFDALDDAVSDAKNIRVSVDPSTAAPSIVQTGVSVSGAALNASGSNQTVRLVVDAPSTSYNITSGYQISMDLVGVPNSAKLDIPVVITLPVPTDVATGRLLVLHYHNGSLIDYYEPSVIGNSLRFAVSSFSDFVITDRDFFNNNVYTGGYIGQPGATRVDPNALDNATLAAIASLASGDVFSDVPAAHWAADQIRWARNANVMGGYSDGSFHPTAATTRQQLWMVLARLDGTYPATMADARAWAVNTGVSDGTNPEGSLSRQQLVTMLYRFAQLKGKDVSAATALSAYKDGAKVASYAKDALSWAVAKGIVTGADGKLNPENTATRAHFAVFLSRYNSTVI